MTTLHTCIQPVAAPALVSRPAELGMNLRRPTTGAKFDHTAHPRYSVEQDKQRSAFDL